jgi:hypothetical protein
MRLSDEGYHALNEINFSILAVGICDSLSVQRPSAQGYVANCYHIIGIFQLYKPCSLHVVKPLGKITWIL